MIPKYAQIKIPNTSPTSHNTAKKIQIMRIKYEVKFLYKKKEQFGIPYTLPSTIQLTKR